MPMYVLARVISWAGGVCFRTTVPLLGPWVLFDRVSLLVAFVFLSFLLFGISLFFQSSFREVVVSLGASLVARGWLGLYSRLACQ